MQTVSSNTDLTPQPFRPRTASFFNIDNQIHGDGVYADIRHYGWYQASDALFEASAFLINFNLKPCIGNRITMQRLGQRGYRTPGNIVFIPAGEAFDTHCEPSELHDLCVTLDPLRAEQLIERNANLCELEPCMDLRDQRVQRCLMRLAEEVAAPSFASDIVVDSLTLLLMVEVYRHLSARKIIESDHVGKMADWRLRRIMERVHDTLETPLSITDLAQEFGISARHLIRTFKNTTGSTLSDYIADLRIQHARELLASKNMLIKAVAASCGFRSAAAFSAAFRVATGQTPREFQQQECFNKKREPELGIRNEELNEGCCHRMRDDNTVRQIIKKPRDWPYPIQLDQE
ncbi:MAG: AraC family transcriptional regulator [Rhizorhabdus sp.]|nr:AraC family transcriptional regulator [Rhizorhabdus sp.]